MNRPVNRINNQALQQLTESVANAIVRVNTRYQADTKPRRFECTQFELPCKLVVYDITIDPIIIDREPGHIATDPNDDYFLTTLLSGKANIEQAGMRFMLEPGTAGLMSGMLPYSVEYRVPSRRLIVRIPGHVFRERLLGRELNAPLGLLPNTGIGRIVVDLLKSAASEAGSLAVTEQYTLVQSLLELTGALIRTSVKNRKDSHREESGHSRLMNRILAYLEEHYVDSDLSPEMIAAANGISTRYLHSLFRQSGNTVQKWVWERRLLAARNDLLDPAKGRARISEIAFRQGFNDTAHFSRSFRNRFGLSPTQLRNLASGPTLN